MVHIHYAELREGFVIISLNLYSEKGSWGRSCSHALEFYLITMFEHFKWGWQITIKQLLCVLFGSPRDVNDELNLSDLIQTHNLPVQIQEHLHAACWDLLQI